MRTITVMGAALIIAACTSAEVSEVSDDPADSVLVGSSPTGGAPASMVDQSLSEITVDQSSPEITTGQAATQTNWFDALRIKPEVSAQLRAAEDRAASDCMAEKGYQVAVAPVSKYIQSMQANDARRWQESPLEQTMPFEEFIAAPAASDLPLDSDDSSDAKYEAMTGSFTDSIKVELVGGMTLEVSSDGCLTAARQEVYGDDLRNAFPGATAASLRGRITTLVETIEPFASAHTEWKSCMEEAGYEFQHFSQANTKASTADNPEQLYERTLFCTGETDLAQKFKQTFNEAADRELNEIANEWFTLLGDLDEILRKIDT